METPTHYELLCVTPEATADEIRVAYRRLIRVYHPDVSGASGEAMTLRLNAAQRDLLDPSLRAQYDRSLRSHAASRSYASSNSPSAPDSPGPTYRPRSSTYPDGSTRRPGYVPPATAAPRRTAPGRTSPTRNVAWTAASFNTWTILTVVSIAAIIGSTAIVLVFTYTGPFELASPRVIPPLVLAIAWIVVGLPKPSKLFVALLVIGGALWPLAALGVGPFGVMTPTVPMMVLASLSGLAISVFLVRLALPRAVELARIRPARRAATA